MSLPRRNFNGKNSFSFNTQNALLRELSLVQAICHGRKGGSGTLPEQINLAASPPTRNNLEVGERNVRLTFFRGGYPSSEGSLAALVAWIERLSLRVLCLRSRADAAGGLVVVVILVLIARRNRV